MFNTGQVVGLVIVIFLQNLVVIFKIGVFASLSFDIISVIIN